MPSEIRQIIFTNRELMDAIRQYNEQSKIKLPRGQFVVCQPVTDGEIGVMVEIDDAMNGKSEHMVLKSSYVAAALVNACLRARIPLPRKSKKSLRIVKDGMALHLTMPSTDFGAVEKTVKPTHTKRPATTNVWDAGPAKVTGS